jgi:catechol 2,3-dioxygenase-like lactoylglutathione lyase family enzyme
MFAKIRHVSLYTDNYESMARFYKTIFGMRQFTNTVEADGRVNRERGQLSDGVIGLAVLSKHPGFQSGLDHFGLEVEDIETVTRRMSRGFPETLMTKGLEAVGFAAMRIHDPAGIHIDLAQKGAANLKDGYMQQGWAQPRHFQHLSIRAANPSGVAEFYQTVFEFSRIPEWPIAEEFCLSDGQSYLIIRPCSNTSYRRMKQGFDHMGFKVEDLEAAKKDLDEIANAFPDSAPRKLNDGRAAAATQKDLDSCPMGKYGISDSDGILIDLS